MNFDRPRELRRNQTEAEKQLWRRLQGRQVGNCKFRRQHPIGPHIVDFVCLDRGLVVEVDGGQHNDAADADERRTAWLNGRGYHVIRFWNNEVTANIEGVLATILVELERE